MKKATSKLDLKGANMEVIDINPVEMIILTSLWTDGAGQNIEKSFDKDTENTKMMTSWQEVKKDEQ